MSIWLLIVVVVVGWTLVSVAFGLFLGRIVRAHQRGGTMDFSGFGAAVTNSSSSAPGIATSSQPANMVRRIVDYTDADEGQSAA